MCGIAGGIGLTPDARPDPVRVSAMSACMCHRGPDGSGTWTSRSGRAVLAHRRLAVIDLETGNQPMVLKETGTGIVFNGEIYNYLELRAELAGEGVEFGTTSDTEVLLKLFARRQERCIGALRGMFAFAAWDDRSSRLLIARDRVGKKPLFYTVSGGILYFASSFSALNQAGGLERALDPEALDLYLSLGYVPAPYTIHRGIFKLPAASFATLEGGSLRVSRYWDLAVAGDMFDGTYDDALDELEAIIEEAVTLRLRSDVPIGIFLSGGVDSSLVAALAARRTAGPVDTFCVGFDEQAFDESSFAAAIAEHIGTRHHTLPGRANLLDALPEMTRHFGEPYADSSALALWAIARHARPVITVALGGDGGDEGFAGYSWYGNAARLSRMASFVPRGWARPGSRAAQFVRQRLPGVRRVGQAERGLAILALSAADRFAALRSFVNEQEAENLYAGEMLERRRAGHDPARDLLSRAYARASGSDLRRIRYVDIATYLADDLMPKVDVATMAHSLEARAPLLDPAVLEFGLSLPDHFLMDQRGGKRILRDLLARHVPAPMFERRKQGFAVPLQLWFATSLRPRLEALADSPALADLGLIDPSGIRRLTVEHAAGLRDHSQRLFCLLQLDYWLSSR
jgi:asparagine synthase (glutamine-hydrolysing)